MNNNTKYNTLNATFSKTLLEQYKYYHLNILGSGNITSDGHGPFIKLDSGSVVYDLRLNNIKSIFGHSHPLNIKAKVSNELNILEENIDETQNFVHKIIGKHNNFLENKKCSFIKNINHFNSFIYLDETSIVDINATQQKFDKINSENIEFEIIESNTLGLSNEDFLYKKFTDKKPSTLISNFNLPFYACFSDQEIENEEISQMDLFLFKSFIRLMYEAHFFGKAGRIFELEKYLNANLLKYNFEGFSQYGLCLYCSKNKINLKTLLEIGILAQSDEQNVYFQIPLSIKKEHITEIFMLIDKHIKEN